MRKLLAISALSLVLASCASDPYGTGQSKGYFLGSTNINTNVLNLCIASNSAFAFKGTQSWLAGAPGMTWYGCTLSNKVTFQPEYTLSYSIIKNDGTGKNVVSTCTPVYKGSGPNTHFTNVQLTVQLSENSPTCEMILN